MTNAPDGKFTEAILSWYRENKRDLPWRQDRDPYHIWVSEIMLQQTRVEAVRDYYLRRMTALPSLQALAEAEEENLLKLWQGLGYYNRVRNLQTAAREIMDLHEGAFPSEFDKILTGAGDMHHEVYLRKVVGGTVFCFLRRFVCIPYRSCITENDPRISYFIAATPFLFCSLYITKKSSLWGQFFDFFLKQIVIKETTPQP